MIDQDQCGMLDTMSSDTGVCCRLIPRLSRGVSRAVSPRSRTDIGASEVGSEDISVPSWALLGPPGPSWALHGLVLSLYALLFSVSLPLHISRIPSTQVVCIRSTHPVILCIPCIFSRVEHSKPRIATKLLIRLEADHQFWQAHVPTPAEPMRCRLTSDV